MPRFHLLEIEDQPWCPAPIRDAATDFLQFALHLGNNYAPIAPCLRQALERAGADRIVDLGSGGGGPWLRMLRELDKTGPPVEVCLTDRYPNLQALERVRRASGDRLDYVRDPVDAAQMPAHLRGFRTLFTAFHHFRPDQARAILHDAVQNRQGIAVFETTQRSLKSIAAVAISPLLVLLFTPFIRPFRVSRFFWTYLVPAVPLVVLWDGVVSCLRTYSPRELRQLVEPFAEEGYAWDIGEEYGKAPIPVTYLIGYPAR